MTEEINIQEAEDQELYEHYRFIVDKGQALLRIDKFLLHKLAGTSRSRVQHAADAGFILVNDKAVKPSYRVRPGDTIVIVLPKPPRDTEIRPENIPLNVVFEDDHLIIINKNPGMVVHPGVGNFNGTLLHALLYHFQHHPLNKKKKKENIAPLLVHRIDKNTSGLMVVTKDETTQTGLAKQFFDHTIERVYLALVWGDLKEETGTINARLGRSIRNRQIIDVFHEEDEGRHAVTHYKVVEKFGYTTLVECRLETGRTHQIRAHFKFFGHPLFNDETYGGNKILKGTTFTKYKQFVENCFQMMPRQALHAKSLGFIHPVTKKKLFFDSELPPDFSAVRNKWRSYAKQGMKE